MNVRRRSLDLVSLFLLALLAGCASLTGSDGADEAVATYQATYQAWLDEGEAEDSALIPDLEQALETITQLGPSAFAASYPEIAESLRTLEEAEAELRAAREEGQVTAALREQHERAEETLLATLAKDLQGETLTTQKSGRIYAIGTVYDEAGRTVPDAQVKVFYRQRGCGWWWVWKYFDGTTDSSGNYSFYKKHRAFLGCSVKTKNFSVLAHKGGRYSDRETDSTYLKGERTFNRLLRLNPRMTVSASNVEMHEEDAHISASESYNFIQGSRATARVSIPVTFDISVENNTPYALWCFVRFKDSKGNYVRVRYSRQCSAEKTWLQFITGSSVKENKPGNSKIAPGVYTPELWAVTWFNDERLLSILAPITVKNAYSYLPDDNDGNDPGDGGGDDGGDPPGDDDGGESPGDGEGDDCTELDENGVPIPCLVIP